MAPIFMLCWCFFSDGDSGKYTAVIGRFPSSLSCIVPLAFTLCFWMLGKGALRLPFISNSISRSGSASELALGPFHYGVCISLCTLLFWKRTEALFCMFPVAFGDGIAAFCGSVRGNKPLWWNASKTWFGFLAFVIVTFMSLVCGCWLFQHNHWCINSDPACIPHALFVSVMCGLAESLSVPNYDNYCIFFIGVLAYAFVYYECLQQTHHSDLETMVTKRL